jgi:hypothetical protein
MTDFIEIDPINEIDPILLYTPIVKAIYDNDALRVKKLISYGADVNKGSTEWTPLHYAINCLNIEIAWILSDSGANIYEDSLDYESPYFFLIRTYYDIPKIVDWAARVSMGVRRGRTDLQILEYNFVIKRKEIYDLAKSWIERNKNRHHLVPILLDPAALRYDIEEELWESAKK